MKLRTKISAVVLLVVLLASLFVGCDSTDPWTEEAYFVELWTQNSTGDWVQLPASTGGGGGAPLTQEQVEDYVGAMVVGNTETLIVVAYQDADGTLDFVVEDDLSLYDNTVAGFLASVDISDDTNLTAGDALTLTDDDLDFDGGAAPGGELGGTWANPTIDSGIHDDEYVELGDAFVGDVTGTYDNTDITEAVLGVGGTDTIFPADPNADRLLMWDDVPGNLAWIAAGTGNVTTDDNLTDNSIIRGDGGTTGVQDSVATISDTGTIYTPGAIDLGEAAEPASPAADTLRLFVTDDEGFSILSFKDSAGMVRKFVKDTVFIAYNERGSTIASGRIVYATGSTGAVPTIDTAQANSTTTMPAVGVTIESIGNGTYGRVMQVGLLEDVNTSAFSSGDILYVSPTTAGIPTITAPTYPNLRQEIGTVLVDDAVVGSIQIVARSVFDDTLLYNLGLNNLTDVSISAPVNNNILVYNSTSGMWENEVDTGSQLTEEEVEDYVGGMVTGNTETLITVTYQDGDGTIDFVVSNNLSDYDNTTSGFLSTVDISDDTNLTAGDALTLTDDDLDFDGGATPGGELGGTWANPTVDSGIHDDEYVELGDAFAGDVTGTYDATDITETVLGVGGTDTVFPADPNADRFLMWDDVPGQLIWENADSTNSTTVDAAGAVMESDFDAKGDILVATADDTPTNVGVGTDGYFLTANSTEASGVQWTFPGLNALADITISSLADGEILVYNSTSQRWENESQSSQLTQEEVEDYVGGMVTGNNETLITVTYQDADGTLDFIVSSNLSDYDNTSSGFLSTVDISDDTNLTAGDALTLTDDDLDFDGGATPGGELGGTWANPTVDSGIHDDEYIELTDNFVGDVTGTYDATDITETVLAVGGSDTIFPADPNTDSFLMWNDNPGLLEWVALGTNSSIWDSDLDTGIQTEEAADEDVIRFDTGGAERMWIDSTGVNFTGLQALAMACQNGDVFPPAPTDGMWFRHQASGGAWDILFQYDGGDSEWTPIISFGAATFYVNTDGGSNDITTTGYDSTHTFDTIQYAVDCIPGLVGGNVIIYIDSGEAAANTYAETVRIGGKQFTGTYTISLIGNLIQQTSDTTDNEAVYNYEGNGARYAILYDSGGFGADYENYLVYVDSTDYRIIDKMLYSMGFEAGAAGEEPDPGEMIEGDASGAWGTVVYVDNTGEDPWAGAGTGVIYYVPTSGTFQDDETVDVMADSSTTTHDNAFNVEEDNGAIGQDLTKAALLGVLSSTPQNDSYIVYSWGTIVSSIQPQGGQVGIELYSLALSTHFVQHAESSASLYRVKFDTAYLYSVSGGSTEATDSLWVGDPGTSRAVSLTGSSLRIDRCKMSVTRNNAYGIRAEVTSTVRLLYGSVIDGTTSAGFTGFHITANCGASTYTAASQGYDRIRNCATALEALYGSSIVSKGAIQYSGNTIDENLTVGGDSSTLILEERSAAIATGAGYGYVWIKDDAPTELYFTDDAGVDEQISTSYLMMIADKTTDQYLKGYGIESIDDFSVEGDELSLWGGSFVHDLNEVNYTLYPDQRFEVQYEDVQVSVDDEGLPIYEERIAWQTVASLNLIEFGTDDLPRSQHIAKLTAVDPSLAKPATVIRRFMGTNYEVRCLVSQSTVSMWQAGTLRVGDYVIVSFIDEMPNAEERNLAIVVDKVYES